MNPIERLSARFIDDLLRLLSGASIEGSSWRLRPQQEPLREGVGPSFRPPSHDRKPRPQRRAATQPHAPLGL